MLTAADAENHPDLNELAPVGAHVSPDGPPDIKRENMFHALSASNKQFQQCLCAFLVVCGCLTLLAGCKKEHNRNTDDETHDPISIPLGVVVTDQLSPTYGNHTDWKNFAVPAPGVLTVRVYWDASDKITNAIVTVHDKYGTQLAERIHDPNIAVDEIVVRVEQGYYLVKVHADQGESIYSMQAQHLEDDPRTPAPTRSPVPAPAPPPTTSKDVSSEPTGEPSAFAGGGGGGGTNTLEADLERLGEAPPTAAKSIQIEAKVLLLNPSETGAIFLLRCNESVQIGDKTEIFDVSGKLIDTLSILDVTGSKCTAESSRSPSDLSNAGIRKVVITIPNR